MPARTVEDDALSRLGKTARRDAKTIEAAIAVRYPDRLSDDNVDIESSLREARLTYSVYTQEGPSNNLRTVRFPESGWLEGDVGDLANLARLVSVPQRAVDQASDNLQSGIDQAATVLGELDDTRGQINVDIANVLGMENVEQTRRMASAIIANAMVFHERIVGMHPDAPVKTLHAIAGPRASNPKGDLLESWRQILTINYYPIFDIAREIIECLPSEPAARLIRILGESGNYVNAAGIDNAHDLTGRVFQRLISDRKYLATFYTRPASAALLAHLAIAKLNHVDWSDPEAIGKLRVADLACGTGALLSATYEQIASRHSRTGGDPRSLHTAMMEDVLIGCDVMPSAVHITAATLAGIEPDVPYSHSHLYVMPYGRQSDGEVKLGSLEFLTANSALTLTSSGEATTRVGRRGEEVAEHVVAEIPDGSLDLVIMNPPFTRSTNHGGALANVVNPPFAAFNASKPDMDAMGERMGQVAKDSCYHGNAGVASAFAALAHKKLKTGGVLALVLPLVATSGLSWQRFRSQMADTYDNVEVLSLAARNLRDISFSADTGLGECLVIGRKETRSITKGAPKFVSLLERPRHLVHSNELGNSMGRTAVDRTLSDGPYGGTILPVAQGGSSVHDQAIMAKIDPSGANWNAVRIADFAVAQTARALVNSQLWLPGQPAGMHLPVVTLNVAGRLGLVDRDVIGPPPRGPFDHMPATPTPTYPSLWNHDAQVERRIVCQPDSQLAVRKGMEAKAAQVWSTASRMHVSRGFRYNAQSLVAAYTERLSIGGRAWPNVIFDDARHEYAFAVWANSTLGMLCYWWQAGRQDAGRGDMTIRAAESMPVLDFRDLTDNQLATAERIFQEFRDKELMPAYLADADPNRDLLDQRVVMDMLGFDKETYLAVRRLAQKWCAEPSVKGGKDRPRDARLIPGNGSPSPSTSRMDIG